MEAEERLDIKLLLTNLKIAIFRMQEQDKKIDLLFKEIEKIQKEIGRIPKV